ncbi:methylmalonyl-CoA mutase subunit beta [Oceanihabitans sediminis]|uniref:Methylmalonyl-CoA mutase n=1 Tax=Oceanihabitans sediminis TaxID=1812012 RepID=A0A368P2W5_9FLAO|nr:methylmalonyl-CoA mutase subunit beta [Oceanihabitans sediminis]MDX1277385.1 methylmalonyl-CoA mutase subunit beta [Oceanihabitans sediminis]RCU56776.1 methylmalonyl-CoA mutase [Oceanihabitans sediminis]
MNKKLFTGFEKVSSKEWKQKIQVDLKGADYNETLIWKTNQGIDVKPFYHADEFEAPFHKISNDIKWSICQSIFVHDVALSNQKALDVLNRGAESLQFILPNAEVSIKDLLQNIDLDKTILYFKLEFLDAAFVKQLSQIPSKAGIYIFTDIIGNLARTGNWFSNLKEDHTQFEAIVKETNSFSIDVSLYQNAGATMVQQLAYALAKTNEYLNLLYNNKEASETKNQELTCVFNVAVGTNYFFEIAKLRALRVLFDALVSEYNIEATCHIVATPSKRNKTIYDYNTNMLRTTTECMSAILGNADAVCNLAYDAIYHKDNEFSDRIARNQLLVLKNESYFDAVENASDGSYYIESLTNQLAEKSLELFKDIEEQGGLLHQLKEGTIQRKIKESAAKEKEQLDAGKMVLLGTNKHPNKADKMKEELELFPFVKTNIRKTLISPIIEKRLAENIEQERLKTEN